MPLDQVSLATTILSAPFTTAFAVLILGALACIMLFAANQVTFHRQRVDVHRLHGAHAGALVGRLTVIGAPVVLIGTGLGATVVLLLGRQHLAIVTAGAPWATAAALVALSVAGGLRVGLRRPRGGAA